VVAVDVPAIMGAGEVALAVQLRTSVATVVAAVVVAVVVVEVEAGEAVAVTVVAEAAGAKHPMSFFRSRTPSLCSLLPPRVLCVDCWLCSLFTAPVRCLRMLWLCACLRPALVLCRRLFPAFTTE
jgi:hypothetical protein